MKVSEILKLKNLGDQLSLLKKNGNKMTDADIQKSIDFYNNDHAIGHDKEKSDIYYEELRYDPVSKKDKTETVQVKQTTLKIPYQRQIVNTACAFVLGNKLDLILNNRNETENQASDFEIFKSCWEEEAKMQSVLKKVFRSTSVQTRTAILFTYDENDDKIKPVILNYENGYNLWRHKDETGKMDCVVVEYNTDEIVNGQIMSGIKYTELWMADKMIRYKNEQDPVTTENPSNKLLIAYFEQSYPEYWFVIDLIDKQDYARSQHSDVNVRIGNPALVVIGELKKKPRYNSTFKVYEVNNKGLDATKPNSGDIKYLELSSAPESVKLELENNERDIFRFTWPDLSTLLTSNGFGNLSGQSIRLMFTQAYVMMAEKQEIYDEMIARCISIMKTMVAIKTGNKRILDLNITFKYNSILPDSLSELVNMLMNAISAGITTTEKGAELLPFNDQETIRKIANAVVEANTNTTVAPTQKETVPPNKTGVNGR